MEILIKINNLSFAYPGMPFVLQDVNLEIKQGEFIAITGPNGSAKTTLLKLILGIYKPQAGTIQLFGQHVSQFKEWYKIGYVPQKTAFFNQNFPATVEEIVGLGLASPDLPKRAKIDRKQKICQVLKVVDLEHKLKSKIGELSGGELQRALIARSLVNDPQILFLDEPTANLDVEAQHKLCDLLTALNKNWGICIAMVTHDSSAAAAASRLIKVDRGGISEVNKLDFERAASW